MNQDQAYTVVGGRGSMTVFEIYIKTTPERLWEAITDGELRKRYSFGVGTESQWTEGSEYRSGVPGVIDIASGENDNNELFGGWPMILSGLKTLLETGEDLDTPGSLRYARGAA